MRHGSPPDFDAEPLMTHREIADVLGYSYKTIIYYHLSRYYAANGIETIKKPLRAKLNDE